MQTKPSIVFCSRHPGSMARGFNKVIPVLQAEGHEVIASSGPRHHRRPSVGAGLREGVRI